MLTSYELCWNPSLDTWDVKWRVVDGKTVRTPSTLPLPTKPAKYKGTGSIDEAANFACRQP